MNKLQQSSNLRLTEASS